MDSPSSQKTPHFLNVSHPDRQEAEPRIQALWSRVRGYVQGSRWLGSKWFIPVTASVGALAILLACVLFAVGGAGMLWWGARDGQVAPGSTPAVVAEVESTPAIVAKTGGTEAVSPLPSPTPFQSVAQEPGPDVTSKLPHNIYLPVSQVPLPPNQAMLKDQRGLVEVQGDDGEWSVASAGEVLEAGQRVRTGELSAVALAFYDGSKALLGPETEVSIDLLGQDEADETRIVELTQWVGESEHDVVPLPDGKGRYEVHTPAGSGKAKGTVFHVFVMPVSTVVTVPVVRFGVDEGAIEVTNVSVTVIVVAGQVTTVTGDQKPSTPVFRVSGEGEVSAIGETWTIAEQNFDTHEGTIIVGNPQVGDWVHVEGRLLADGTRVADRIVLLRRAPANRFTIQGEVTAIGDTEWTVAGQAIQVNEDTQIEEGIESGDLVRVDGILTEEGAFLAEEIHLLEEILGLPFHFVGVVQEMGDESWTISGISVTVDTETAIDEDLALGDVALVRGWIQEGDVWLARSIVRLMEHENDFEFVGYVQSLDPWVVSDIGFETREWTEIDVGIAVGDLVKVEGQILEDGTWVADEIVLLENQEMLYLAFTGVVQEMGADVWTISGISITVDTETEIVGLIEVGTLVKVRAQILEDGTLLALKIKPITVEIGEGCMYFTSVVVSVQPGQIVLLHGPTLTIDEGVYIDGDLRVDSVISFYVCVDEDGNLVVVGIIVLYQLEPTIIILPPPVPPQEPVPPPSDGYVTICHKPGTPAEKTMRVPQSALKGHLGHGDKVGPCK